MPDLPSTPTPIDPYATRYAVVARDGTVMGHVNGVGLGRGLPFMKVGAPLFGFAPAECTATATVTATYQAAVKPKTRRKRKVPESVGPTELFDTMQAPEPEREIPVLGLPLPHHLREAAVSE